MIEPLVLATIEKIVIGSEHEGHVFDRWITLRSDDATEVRVFDHYFDLVEVPLKVGDRVGVAIDAVLFADVEHPLSMDVRKRSRHRYEGTVAGFMSVSELAGFRYAVASEHIDQSFAAVELPFGRVLVGLANFRGEVQIGELVGWDNVRYDLVAITQVPGMPS